MPTDHNRRLRQGVAHLDALIQKFIDDRRASGQDKGDFLSLLLPAHDEDASEMTDIQVRDEAVTLLAAGHETTAVTLTWVWYLLSQHPEVEARLDEELCRVLAGRMPTLNDLPQLVYAEQIVKEALRLYPPAWSIPREAREDVTLSQYRLKKGQVLIVNVYGLHHDPRYYPNPNCFDPQRFSPENEPNIPKHAYLPFGGGPRICIGYVFALMEARLLLATLAQHFKLSLVPGFSVIPDRQFALRPKYGLPMIVTVREQSRVANPV